MRRLRRPSFAVALLLTYAVIVQGLVAVSARAALPGDVAHVTCSAGAKSIATDILPTPPIDAAAHDCCMGTCTGGSPVLTASSPLVFPIGDDSEFRLPQASEIVAAVTREAHRVRAPPVVD